MLNDPQGGVVHTSPDVEGSQVLQLLDAAGLIRDTSVGFVNPFLEILANKCRGDDLLPIVLSCVKASLLVRGAGNFNKVNGSFELASRHVPHLIALTLKSSAQAIDPGIVVEIRFELWNARKDGPVNSHFEFLFEAKCVGEDVEGNEQRTREAGEMNQGGSRRRTNTAGSNKISQEK